MTHIRTHMYKDTHDTYKDTHKEKPAKMAATAGAALKSTSAMCRVCVRERGRE